MCQEVGKLAGKIQELLKLELPGSHSHQKMMPENRKLFSDLQVERLAAVVVLLFPEGGDIKISLIQRTRYDGAHSGQISFPGGMKEGSDPDLKYTGLRETSEETGIFPDDIQILGSLSPVIIPVSRFEVHPFVGMVYKTPHFRPDPKEVEFMINIPVRHFLEGRNRLKEEWNLSGTDIKIPFFQYENFRIWGATAMIFSEFLDVIEAIEQDLWALQCSGND